MDWAHTIEGNENRQAESAIHSRGGGRRRAFAEGFERVLFGLRRGSNELKLARMNCLLTCKEARGEGLRLCAAAFVLCAEPLESSVQPRAMAMGRLAREGLCAGGRWRRCAK